MDACGIDHHGEELVVAIVTGEERDEVDEQDTPHHLVTVHVANVLELRLSCNEGLSQYRVKINCTIIQTTLFILITS